jgi:CheY-like chemotaxis protein
MRRLVTKVLGSCGVMVRAASDGLEALKAFSDGTAETDIICADIRMPNMDGMEFAKRLRKQGVQIPIVFVSGTLVKAQEGYRQRSNLYLLSKPFSPTKLADIVKDLLGRTPPQPGAPAKPAAAKAPAPKPPAPAPTSPSPPPAAPAPVPVEGETKPITSGELAAVARESSGRVSAIRRAGIGLVKPAEPSRGRKVAVIVVAVLLVLGVGGYIASLRSALKDARDESRAQADAITLALARMGSEENREVRALAVRLAKRTGLDRDDILAVGAAALMVDLESVPLPDRPGGGSTGVLTGAAGHVLNASRERWDGSGEPRSLAGEDIPAGARALFLASVYVAMTSPRLDDKDELNPEQALAEIAKLKGSWFEPRLVDLLPELVGSGRTRPPSE